MGACRAVPATFLELVGVEFSGGEPQRVDVSLTQRPVVTRALVAEAAPRVKDMVATHILEPLEDQL